MSVVPSIISETGSIADFLTNAVSIDSCTVEKNINGDGKLSISWKSVTSGILPAGTEVDAGEFGKFILQDHYVPTDNGDGLYTYSPSFICKDYELTGLLFSMTLQASDVLTGKEEAITLYTFPYTGTVRTVCEHLAEISGYTVNVASGISDLVISVSFDGDNCKSAAQKIASAAGVSVVFTGGVIGIGTAEAYSPDAYYDRFVVLGGTRNMGKKSLSGYYATVTQRLMIDTPGSIIGPSEAKGHRTKLLINDDIYPKMELVITSVADRMCWMYDEGGNKIIDYYIYESTGEKAVYDHEEVTEIGTIIYYDANNNPIEPIFKKYCKWYITLGIEGADEQVTPYAFDVSTLLAGCPLGMLFQSGILAGREFDLSYFDSDTTEHEADDIEEDGFEAKAGMYRIIMQADGSVLLPSMPEYGMCPAVGDKVTLINIAMDEQYINAAKAKLLAWGTQMASFYSQVTPESYQIESTWNDFLTGSSRSYDISTPVDASGNPVSGDGKYIVTSVETDLINGKQTVTYGTFKAKGLMQSLVDKVEGANLSGGGTTTGVDDYRHTAPIGIDSFNALHHAGGNVQVIGLNKKISTASDKIDEVYEPFQEVLEQIDQKFDVWYGNGSPLPHLSEYGGEVDDQTEAEANYPASEWETNEDKATHIQDIYYDMLREPGLKGGSAWRWTYNESTGKYYWEDITDSQTLASLEKISDVASDGKLTGGVEKIHVYIDYVRSKNEYLDHKSSTMSQWVSAGTWSAYENAFYNLAYVLNGYSWDEIAETHVDDSGNTIIDSFDMDAVPMMLRNLNETSIIGTTDDEIQPYYDAWQAYYYTLALLNTELASVANVRAKESLDTIDNISSDLWITAIEKTQAGGLIDKWAEIVAERTYFEVRAVTARLSKTEGAYADYIAAYYNLGSFLNDFKSTTWDGSDPAMLNNGEDTQINEDLSKAFKGYWKSYYDARENLLTAVAVKRETYFVSQDVPTPPYQKGDLWMKVSNADFTQGTLMMCIASRDNGTGDEKDWVEYAINTNDPKMLLASIIEGLYNLGVITGEKTQEIEIDDIKGDNSDLVTLVKDTFTRFCTIAEVSVIKVYATRPDKPSLYDVVVRPLSMTIHGKKYTTRIYTEMYDGNGWVIIISSVGSVIENLGDVINLIVYGNTEGSSDGVISAAGAQIKKDFVTLFAEAKLRDPEDSTKTITLAEALFGITVTPVKDTEGQQMYDENGYPLYESKMNIGADKIEFRGKMSVKNDNNDVTFSISPEGDVYSAGDYLSVNKEKNIYSKMAAGQFELGIYKNEEGTDQYIPKYVFNLDTANNPIFSVCDNDGNPVGQITEELFTNITEVKSTWTLLSYIPVTPEMSYSDIKQQNAVLIGRFTQGYKVLTDAQGNKTRKYTNADGTTSSAPDPTINGMWFTQQIAQPEYYAKGKYCSMTEIVEKVGTNVYKYSRQRYYFDNGIRADDGTAFMIMNNNGVILHEEGYEQHP